MWDSFLINRIIWSEKYEEMLGENKHQYPLGAYLLLETFLTGWKMLKFMFLTSESVFSSYCFRFRVNNSPQKHSVTQN